MSEFKYRAAGVGSGRLFRLGMMMQRKPYEKACEENGPPLVEVLAERLPPSGQVLEIGSGTGQHAVMFAAAFPHLQWQTSDRAEMHDGIRLWLDEAQLLNLLPPLSLDVVADSWPAERFDAIFSANTAHIMPEEAVVAMFEGVAKVMAPEGRFLLYGPFIYNGEHTSESNWRFDRWIRSWERHRGLRDVIWLQEVADRLGLTLLEDVEMPQNNRTLVWSRQR